MRRSTQKKIWHAFGLCSALRDADEAGYLDLNESMAVQKARIDFQLASQDAALRLLREYHNAIPSKAAASHILQTHLDTGHVVALSADQNNLIQHFLSEFDVVIDREAARSASARNRTRLILAIPNAFRFLALAFLLIVMVLGVKDLLLK